MDPKYTSDGKPYGPWRFRTIVEECYGISKFTNTPYTAVLEMTPLERKYVAEMIIRDNKRESENINKNMSKSNH